jgi:hypothetical protein
LRSGRILDGDISEELAFLANVCCLQWPVLEYDAESVRETWASEFGNIFMAKTLLFLSGFATLARRAESGSRKTQGGCNDFVRSPFFTINAK